MDVSERISKEEFLAAYNNYPPNGWTKFAFKYFSQSTLPKDKFLKRIAIALMLGSFIMGFIGTVFNLGSNFIKVSIIPFCIILLLVAILMSGAAIMNNLRIRKIRKKLGITQAEYDALVSMYLE
jgi:hypothetical protein